MRIAASTLGCPDWSLSDVLRGFPAYGLEAVDFRGLAEGIDVTVLPDFTTGLAATARRLKDAGLAVTAISSGINIAAPDKKADNVEEARRAIPVALGLGAELVRVFGGGPLSESGGNRAELAAAAHDCLRAILDLPDAGRLRWLVETHDNWIAAEHVHMLIDPLLPTGSVGVLWDIAHTARFTTESPEQIAAAYDGLVGNLHIKDAVRQGDVWDYVAPGRGELEIAAAIRAFHARSRYDGPLTLEHEKRWHKGLAPAEVIFPEYAAWARELRRELEAGNDWQLAITEGATTVGG